MTDPAQMRTPTGKSPCTDGRMEALHAYLDGELAVKDQPALFEHLAACPGCRRTMDSVLAFRRMSRQEYMALPPSADETFFQKLAHLKEVSGRFDRSADRRPLWSARRSISLRSALLLAAVVFAVGLVVPMPARTEYATALISLELERVKFEPSDSVYLISHIYVMDGPTVEGSRDDESAVVAPEPDLN